MASRRDGISIHAPPRGATSRSSVPTAHGRYFNSRPSARGDGGCTRNHLFQGISIHAPPRGATTARGWEKKRWKFQFTPLREGRQERDDAIYDAKAISIHAPPRGATAHQPPEEAGEDFNSRPSARGDSTWGRGPSDSTSFQFTPLREGRPQISPPDESRTRISIHAPPRGATQAACTLTTAQHPISIHAPPRGATFVAFRQRFPCKFQFTPLREGRLACSGVLWRLWHFNSRPSARGDASGGLSRRPDSRFQFTPLREGRRDAQAPPRKEGIFQFTPLREGRPAARNCPDSRAGFQFTPLREGRRQKICNFCKSFVQPLQISMA